MTFMVLKTEGAEQSMFAFIFAAKDNHFQIMKFTQLYSFHNEFIRISVYIVQYLSQFLETILIY